MELISKGYRFRRGTGSPFDAVSHEDFGRNVHWCRHCHMAVDAEESAYNQHQVWAKKYWCKRCGEVMTGAVYFHAGSIATIPSQLFEKARQWASTKESITK